MEKVTLLRDLRLAVAAGFVVFLSAACSLFGAVPPQSPSEALAYAYGTVATVRQTAATALQSGTINVSTAQTVLKDTDDARAALDAGEAALIAAPVGESSPQPNIQGYLSTATQLLTAAQKLLPQQVSSPLPSVSASASVSTPEGK